MNTTSSKATPRALEYVPVAAFQDNYIWVVSDGHAAAVVDPGDAAPVSAYLRQHGLRLSTILLTHHHHDHVGGVAELLREFGDDAGVAAGVAVYAPATEAIEHVTQPLRGGDTFEIDAPRLALAVLDVPGHTSGHIAYFQAAAAHAVPHLFCGDTLFASGCGRLFEGTAKQMLHSLDTLAALPEATQVHCAHEYTLSNIRFALACEPDNADLLAWQQTAQALRARGAPTLPTTIGHEKRVNPFLRTDLAAVRQRLAQAPRGAPRGDGSGDDSERVAAFAAMRGWKDKFR